MNAATIATATSVAINATANSLPALSPIFTSLPIDIVFHNIFPFLAIYHIYPVVQSAAKSNVAVYERFRFLLYKEVSAYDFYLNQARIIQYELDALAHLFYQFYMGTTDSDYFKFIFDLYTYDKPNSFYKSDRNLYASVDIHATNHYINSHIGNRHRFSHRSREIIPVILHTIGRNCSARLKLSNKLEGRYNKCSQPERIRAVEHHVQIIYQALKTLYHNVYVKTYGHFKITKTPNDILFDTHRLLSKKNRANRRCF